MTVCVVVADMRLYKAVSVMAHRAVRPRAAAGGAGIVVLLRSSSVTEVLFWLAVVPYIATRGAGVRPRSPAAGERQARRRAPEVRRRARVLPAFEETFGVNSTS